MKVFGYSERGMLNAIFFGISAMDEAKGIATLGELLELIKFDGIKLFDKSKVMDAKVIMEPSLSDFGDPDVVIIFRYDGEKYVLFIEAKVKTWHNKKWNADKSRFSIQLKRLKLMVDKGEVIKNKYRVEDGNGKVRKMGKNGVILNIFNYLIDAQKFFYVALLPNEVRLPENFGLLLWKDIEDKLEIPGLKECFIFNTTIEKDGKERSQIYNK